MSTNPSSTANLPCEQCGYLNEPERVYCHNCGAKLDRSLLPKTEEQKQEGPEKARKRIQKITNPQSNKVWGEVKMLFKVAFWAVVFAALIQIARPPDGLPADKKETLDRSVDEVLMEGLQSPTPVAISFTEEQINEYLKKKLKAKDGSIPGVQFTRAFVHLRPGGVRLNSQNSVFGYPAYSGIEYFVEVKDGKLVRKVIGGNLGRLKVDPQLMKYGEFFFEGIATALESERKRLEQMSSIVVEDKHVDMVTKGGAPR